MEEMWKINSELRINVDIENLILFLSQFLDEISLNSPFCMSTVARVSLNVKNGPAGEWK